MEQGKGKIFEVVMAVIIVVAAVIGIMLITAALMQFCAISGSAVTIAVIILDILPVFAGGFYLGKRVKEKKYIWGLILAAIISLLYILIKAVCFGNAAFDGNGARTIALIMLSGMAGGMLS